MPATLTSRIPEIISTMQETIESSLEIGAERIAETARSRVEYGPDPFHIRDDIRVVSIENGWAVLAGGEHTYYGHILEFGGKTRNYAPRPFLVPSFEQHYMGNVMLVAMALRSM